MPKATADFSTNWTAPRRDGTDGALAEPGPRLTRSERLEPTPQADPTISQSKPPVRRDLLAACGAFLVIRGTPAMAQEPANKPPQLGAVLPVFSDTPDSRLIDLCSRFDKVERQRQGLSFNYKPGTPDYEAEEAIVDRIMDVQDNLLDQMEDHPPQTVAGIRAVARTLCLEDDTALLGEEGITDRFRALILNALVAEGMA